MVNPNTVARAYRELEQAGIVTKRRTTGSYISAGAVSIDKKERKDLLVEKVDGLLADARQLDLLPDDVVELIRERSPSEATTP
jgi:GntR family transcriptional regulator